MWRSDASSIVEVPAPKDEALQALDKIIAPLMKLLTRVDDARTLRPLQAAALHISNAFGPRAGLKVFTVQ